jgi:endonuclease YncB( thermonuclease family)
MASLSHADYGSVPVERIRSIYDGDTFRVDIAGWPRVIGENMPVKVAGIDTPERRGKCAAEKELAMKARQYTVQRLRNAGSVTLSLIERGKYFRLLAEVYIDGESLTDGLINNGYAVEYYGGKKMDWCAYLSQAN